MRGLDAASAEARSALHYEVEVELAARLRSASKEERRAGLYAAIYQERIERIPMHPLLVRSKDEESRRRATALQLRLLTPWLTQDTVFAEIGPGDCALALAVATRVKTVYAVDVTDVLVTSLPRVDNFHLLQSDGVDVPIPPGTADLIYSNQVLEHLHPEDAGDHLQAVYAALASGGRLVCVTPNRLSGPWDISRQFDPAATGLHLREYTTSELSDLLRSCGFSVRLLTSYHGRHLFPVPETATRVIEAVLEPLPRALRRPIASGLTAIKVVATKSDQPPSRRSLQASQAERDV